MPQQAISSFTLWGWCVGYHLDQGHIGVRRFLHVLILMSLPKSDAGGTTRTRRQAWGVVEWVSGSQCGIANVFVRNPWISHLHLKGKFGVYSASITSCNTSTHCSDNGSSQATMDMPTLRCSES